MDYMDSMDYMDDMDFAFVHNVHIVHLVHTVHNRLSRLLTAEGGVDFLFELFAEPLSGHLMLPSLVVGFCDRGGDLVELLAVGGDDLLFHLILEHFHPGLIGQVNKDL